MFIPFQRAGAPGSSLKSGAVVLSNGLIRSFVTAFATHFPAHTRVVRTCALTVTNTSNHCSKDLKGEGTYDDTPCRCESSS